VHEHRLDADLMEDRDLFASSLNTAPPALMTKTLFLYMRM